MVNRTPWGIPRHAISDFPDVRLGRMFATLLLCGVLVHEEGRHTMNRKNCLLHDEEVQGAIELLLLRLSDDHFKHGLRECSECSRCLDKETAILLHCQLKTIHDILTGVRVVIDKLQEIDT